MSGEGCIGEAKMGDQVALQIIYSYLYNYGSILLTVTTVKAQKCDETEANGMLITQ